jgi:hypothetical protein
LICFSNQSPRARIVMFGGGFVVAGAVRALALGPFELGGAFFPLTA